MSATEFWPTAEHWSVKIPLVTPHQRLVREMVLQLKTGALDPDYFRAKFNVDIMEEFSESFARHAAAGFLTLDGRGVRVTREGLLQVDRLLPAFFEPEHQGTRYW